MVICITQIELFITLCVRLAQVNNLVYKKFATAENPFPIRSYKSKTVYWADNLALQLKAIYLF